MDRPNELRLNLELVADLLPLTDREARIANLIFREDDHADLAHRRRWYGEKAIGAYEAVVLHQFGGGQ